MNYMKQVAQVLGVELGEDFKIKGRKETFKFNDCHLLCRLIGSNTWDKCDVIFMLLLSGKDEIQKPILDKKEKEYLAYLIRPFRKKVKYVKKHKFQYQKNYEYLQIVCRANHRTEFVEFPSFKEGMMYQGMELEKEYTLDELGI